MPGRTAFVRPDDIIDPVPGHVKTPGGDYRQIEFQGLKAGCRYSLADADEWRTRGY